MVQTYFLYYVFYHFMYFGTSCGLKLIAVVISRMLESSAFIKTKFQQAFNFWQKVGAEIVTFEWFDLTCLFELVYLPALPILYCGKLLVLISEGWLRAVSS